MTGENTALRNKTKDKRRSEASGKMSAYYGNFIFTKDGFRF